MLTRREALLGVLLAPLVKPLAGVLPKRQTVVHWRYSVDDGGGVVRYTVFDDPETGDRWMELGDNCEWAEEYASGCDVVETPYGNFRIIRGAHA